MNTRQMIVAYFCILFASQQALAVVNNNGQNTEESTPDTVTKNTNVSENSANNSSTSSVPDSLADSSDTVRREAPFTISASYELPIQENSGGHDSSYQLQSSNSLSLPIPVYGVPDAPSNNIVYPAPPPDIPPPQNQLPNNVYGPPAAISFPPVKFQSTFFSNQLKPYSFSKPIYGPPQSYSHGPNFGSSIKSQYGPPKPYYINYKLPKPIYGPPLKHSKPYFGKPIFSSNKPLNLYGSSNAFFNIQKDNIYGPPKPVYGPPKPLAPIPPVAPVQTLHPLPPSPQIQYGPPEPIPHGPPHPGAPAPPTPPDIKYDGWQPIPGLVSRPPSDSYGVPKNQLSGLNDLQQNIDFLPPIEGLLGDSGKGTVALSDSYGAPLNTVTGSGGIVSTSGDALRNNGGNRNELSVVKSLGFDLSPPHNSGVNLNINTNFIADSYSAPPLNSYSPNGPYAASHSYKENDVLLLPSLENFASSLVNSFESTLGGGHNHGNQFSSGIGLIPPSGLYGVPPNGKYGTPLIHHSNKYSGGPPLNFKPPKHPVAFREPVPTGLIQSIGKGVAQKDAHGIIENIHSNKYSGPAYVPPPVPDVGDYNRPYKNGPPSPSTLYSLPIKNSISFQNVAHGSSSVGLNNNFNHDFHNYNGGGYGGAFALPQATSNLPVYTGGYSNFQNIGYDCSHKSHIFGVPPSNNGYTNSLSGNFGGISDLHISHSQPNTVVSGPNSLVEDSKLVNSISGKSLAQSFAPGGELIKSESLDLNNIPLQGALGSYTLQIQSANSDGSESKIANNQVFNDQLFQSILNAIEQPEHNSQNVLGQQLINVQQLPPQSQSPEYQLPPQQDYQQLSAQPQQDYQLSTQQGYQLLPQHGSAYGGGSGEYSQFNLPDVNSQNTFHHSDSDGQNSITKNVVVSPPSGQSSDGNKENATNSPQIDDIIEVPQIDNNEIAIYFNKTNTDDAKNKKAEISNEVNQNRNGQQYGSYVSFKSDTANFEYGDMNVPNNSTEDSASKSPIKTAINV